MKLQDSRKSFEISPFMWTFILVACLFISNANRKIPDFLNRIMYPKYNRFVLIFTYFHRLAIILSLYTAERDDN